jgi:outer membrane protein with beta-barrel domain
MTSRLVAVWIFALLTIVPAEARADWIVRPFIGAAVSPSHGFVDLEQSSGDSKLVWGAAAGWHPRAIGVEFELSVVPGFFDGPGDLIIAGRVTTVMGNVTWQLPKPNESSRLRAYVAGGAGLVRVRLEDALDAFSSTTSLAAGSAGGGVLVRLRPRFDINADVRYFKTQYGDVGRAGFGEQFVSFTRVTGGVVVRF